MTGSRVRQFFIDYRLKKVMIDEFLAQYFKDAGYSHVTLWKTPLGWRVTIYAEYPGRFIGRGGSVIKKLTTIFQTHFGLSNVNITVSPVPDPDLNARIVAYRLVRALEKEIPYRRAIMVMIRRVMSAGAIGVEISISGKLRSERARTEKYRAGRIYKAGEIVEYMVDRAVATALLKPGVYGIEVIIVKPVAKPPDYIEFKPVKPEDIERLKPKIEIVEVEKSESG